MTLIPSSTPTNTATGTRETSDVTDQIQCSVRVISSTSEFDGLEEPWNKLLDQADSTIYQTFEWQRTWWEYFAQSSDSLFILLFESDNNIIGIAPLYRRTKKIFGTAPVVHIQFIANGLSDYIDCIIQSGYEEIIYKEFIRFLQSHAREWDVLDIEDVNESSAIITSFLPLLKNAGIRTYQYQGNVCPQIALPAAGEPLAKSMGPSKSDHFKRKFKRLQQSFNATVEVIQHETDDIRKGIDHFARIHGERWNSLGYPSAFDDEHQKVFHEEFSKKFARRGWLRMYFLNVDEKPVAVSFTFHYNKRVYMYHSNAHGSEEVMKCSPGFLIRNIAMVGGINEGLSIFDYLRGDEPYKYKEWNATNSKNYLVRLSSPSGFLRLRLLLFLTREFFQKASVRTRRELFEFKRFTIIKPRTIFEKFGYVVIKVTNLFILGYNFTVRHVPIEAVHKLQVKQRSAHEELFNESSNNSEQRLTITEKIRIGLSRFVREFRQNRLLARYRRYRYGQKVVAEIDSPISGKICVADFGPERQLTINGKIQSLAIQRGSWNEVRREYWGQILESPFRSPSGSTILLLGLGGGSILKLLHEDTHPAQITVIEKDPQIVEVAKQYFGLDQIPNVELSIGDVRTTLKRMQAAGTKFDLIIDDIFTDPASTTKDQDLALIKQYSALLQPNGSLVLQKSISDNVKIERVQQLADSLQQLQYTVVIKQVHQRWQNDILYCQPTQQP